MGKFSHIQDEGVRTFLEDSSPPLDFNLFAKQLTFAAKALIVGSLHQEINCQTIEARADAYQDAEEYFGLRNLGACHQALRRFWDI
jgi:hypothetical protein